MDSLGIYISVPFCRAKCSFCNFASGVFAAERMAGYVERVCAEVRGVRSRVAGSGSGAEVGERVDSIYLGGGTPSLLEAAQVRRLFEGLRGEFDVSADAEITVECAPGQMEEATLEELLRQGMNRVSFGVQSFVDRESAAVGRSHTGRECRDEIARMRAAGVGNVGVDLIVGLPHQTAASVESSVRTAVACGVEHVSLYMLEVDGDSRLGREFARGGGRYGAGALPGDDEAADWYLLACEHLAQGGVAQYEISNLARAGFASRHNLKYWRREEYLGFGLDAHSMLRAGTGGVRFANGKEMEGYMQGPGSRDEGPAHGGFEVVGVEAAFEEALFLGLRLVEGVGFEDLRREFGNARVEAVAETVREAVEAGLMETDGDAIRLTGKGRLASNEVFGRLLGSREAVLHGG